MMRALASITLGLFTLSTACASRESSVSVQQTAWTLPSAWPENGKVIGRVGDEPLTAEELESVMQQRNLGDVRAALDVLVRERLLAQAARQRAIDSDPLVLSTYRRAVIQTFLHETVEREMNDSVLRPEQVQARMRAVRFELSHGELFRTEHVLVLLPKSGDPAQIQQARARAESMRAKVVQLAAPRMGTALEQLAVRELAGIEYKYEALPPVDREGTTAKGTFDQAFALAASQLTNPGDVSPVVETRFGFHVIVLAEKIPAKIRSDEEIESIVKAELVAGLRRKTLESLLKTLRTKYNSQIPEDILRTVETVRLDTDGQ